MNTDPEVCPVCGHRPSPRWARITVHAIGSLAILLVATVLVALIALAARTIT